MSRHRSSRGTDTPDAPEGARHTGRALPVRILGLDVTSSPGPGKPLALAVCNLAPGSVETPGPDAGNAGAPPVLTLCELRTPYSLNDLDRLFSGALDASFDGASEAARPHGACAAAGYGKEAGWIAGIDAALAQPLELVQALGWPREWAEYAALCGAMSRAEFRDLLRGFSAARPAGSKYLFRACCRRAGAASPMNTVNPPVGLMFHAVAPRLAAHPVHVPLLRPLPEAARVALETYPGWLARRIMGRTPYKGGGKADEDTRRNARMALLEGLRNLAAKEGQENGNGTGQAAQRPESALPHLTVNVPPDLAARMVDDREGDLLDALLCAVQAAWAVQSPGYGLPNPQAPSPGVTGAQLRTEGWIAGLPPEVA